MHSRDSGCEQAGCVDALSGGGPGEDFEGVLTERQQSQRLRAEAPGIGSHQVKQLGVSMAASLVEIDTVQDTAVRTVYLCQVWSPKVNCDRNSIWQTGSVLYTPHVLSNYSSLSRIHWQPLEGRLLAIDKRSLRTGGDREEGKAARKLFLLPQSHLCR